jgi:hypothetical protein
LFYKLGFSLAIATVIPSIMAYILIGLFLFYWLKKYMLTPIAFLSGLLIMFSMFAVNMAGLSTPDCLSAFFFFVATYFILETPRIMFIFTFFLLSIVTRVDNVIVCFFVSLFLAWHPRWKLISKKQFFAMTAVFAVAYICVLLPVRQFGSGIVSYSQYVRHIDFSKEFNQSIGVSAYIALVFSKLVTAVVSTQFTLFMFMCLLILGKSLSNRKFSLDQALVLVLIGVIFFRFILLPDLSDRFYFGFYLLIIVLLAKSFSPKLFVASGGKPRH